MKEILSVAGVTFANDNGESRQEILKNLGVNNYITVNLLKQKFQNNGKTEIAIACVERNTKKQIGFIHREDICPELLTTRQLTGVIGWFSDKGIYYCQLSQIQPPTSEMHQSVKIICQNRGIPMPAYDMRAYIAFS